MSKFKILWIDDQPEKIGLEKDNLEKIVEMRGLPKHRTYFTNYVYRFNQCGLVQKIKIKRI